MLVWLLAERLACAVRSARSAKRKRMSRRISGIWSVPVKLFLKVLCMREERNGVSTATVKLSWL